MNKTVKRLTIVLLALTPLMVMLAFAQTREEGHSRMERQEGMRRGSGEMIPNLSDEQKEKMKTLKVQFLKESLPLKNELNEKKAKYRTLSTAENVDMKAIENLVDESGKIEIELKKQAARNHQQIRGLLTDEQKVMFDARAPGMNRERMAKRRGSRGAEGKKRQMRMEKNKNQQ